MWTDHIHIVSLELGHTSTIHWEADGGIAASDRHLFARAVEGDIRIEGQRRTRKQRQNEDRSFKQVKGVLLQGFSILKSKSGNQKQKSVLKQSFETVISYWIEQ